MKSAQESLSQRGFTDCSKCPNQAEQCQIWENSQPPSANDCFNLAPPRAIPEIAAQTGRRTQGESIIPPASGGEDSRETPSPNMSIIRWFLRLVGIRSKPESLADESAQDLAALLARNLKALDKPGNRPEAAPSAPASPRRMQIVSAEEVLRRILELEKRNATWPEILGALNPGNDPQVQHMLTNLQGPHLFAPHVALNVLREGCQRVLAANPRADRMAALQAALKSGDPFSRDH